MKLNEQDKKELEELYQSFLTNPLIQKMKDIPMHRGSNCYKHSFKVAKIAIGRVKNNTKYNLKNLLISCILHDYYLYDWRKHHELKKKHGSRHPLIAIENARRDFQISDEVADIIRSHMWPLTPKYFPKTREAKLLNWIDDVVATREFLTCKKHKIKHQDRYDKFISKLFDD